MISAASGTGGVAGRRTPAWYVLSRLSNNRLEVFTVPPQGRTLPVFETEAGARAYLERRELRGWHVRETTAGELVSLLFYLPGVESVACDPQAGTEEKRAFVDRLLESPLLVAAAG